MEEESNMGYLSKYLYYNSGNECPESFWRWSALSLLGHVIGPKVWFMHGAFPITPQLYVGMFGSMGSGKSTAKDGVKSIVTKEFPSLLYSASIQSREHIIDEMLDGKVERAWTVPGTSEVKTFSPYYILANEFEAFLSVNPNFMIQFLVDIFDTGHFSKGFKKDRDNGKPQGIDKPCVSLLSCGTPEWLMRELRTHLFVGGLGRRLIVVVDEPSIACHRPHRPGDADLYYKEIVKHLNEAYYAAGEIKETPNAAAWWKDWYYPHKANKPKDPLGSAFHSTEHVMLMKLACLLTMDDFPFPMVLDVHHYVTAKAMLDLLKPNVERLTSGAGRNVIAGFATELTEYVREQGGFMLAKKLEIVKYRDAPNFKRGYDEALTHLKDTNKIVIADTQRLGIDLGPMRFIFLPYKWDEYMAMGSIEFFKKNILT